MIVHIPLFLPFLSLKSPIKIRREEKMNLGALLWYIGGVSAYIICAKYDMKWARSSIATCALDSTKTHTFKDIVWMGHSIFLGLMSLIAGPITIIALPCLNRPFTRMGNLVPYLSYIRRRSYLIDKCLEWNWLAAVAIILSAIPYGLLYICGTISSFEINDTNHGLDILQLALLHATMYCYFSVVVEEGEHRFSTRYSFKYAWTALLASVFLITRRGGLLFNIENYSNDDKGAVSTSSYNNNNNNNNTDIVSEMMCNISGTFIHHTCTWDTFYEIQSYQDNIKLACLRRLCFEYFLLSLVMRLIGHWYSDRVPCFKQNILLLEQHQRHVSSGPFMHGSSGSLSCGGYLVGLLSSAYSSLINKVSNLLFNQMWPSQPLTGSTKDIKNAIVDSLAKVPGWSHPVAQSLAAVCGEYTRPSSLVRMYMDDLSSESMAGWHFIRKATSCKEYRGFDDGSAGLKSHVWQLYNNTDSPVLFQLPVTLSVYKLSVNLMDNNDNNNINNDNDDNNKALYIRTTDLLYGKWVLPTGFKKNMSRFNSVFPGCLAQLRDYENLQLGVGYLPNGLCENCIHNPRIGRFDDIDRELYILHGTSEVLITFSLYYREIDNHNSTMFYINPFMLFPLVPDDSCHTINKYKEENADASAGDDDHNNDDDDNGHTVPQQGRENKSANDSSSSSSNITPRFLKTISFNSVVISPPLPLPDLTIVPMNVFDSVL